MYGKRKTSDPTLGQLSKMAKIAKVLPMAVKSKARPVVRGAIRPSGRPELKFVDVAQATYAIDTTGSVTALNLIATGDDFNTRDGRQVQIKSVQVRGWVQPQDGAVDAQMGRVMLVWDNAVPASGIATITEILSAANGTAFPLINNAQRFTILVDRTLALGAYSNGATISVAQPLCVQPVTIYKKLNCVTQYDGTAADIASVQNGALYLVTIGSNGSGLGHQLTATTRVRYTDV